MNPFDIIARLERSPAAWVCIRRDAADRIKADAARIKALEAKLAIAVEALEEITDIPFSPSPSFEMASEALAKIKENTK